jgi:hypothetical protein
MSYSEASWHAHTAAIRAEVETGSRLASPVALAAVSVPTVKVAGVDFRPLTAGGLLAIQLATKLAAEAGTMLHGPDEVAVLVYCLAASEDAFALAQAGRLNDLLSAARLLLAPVPLDQLPELTRWCTEAIARATGQAPAKKPEAATAPAS